MYIQTTNYTTAVCSLINILKILKPTFKPTKEIELEFWIKSANLPIRAANIFSLASIAKEQGLNPLIYTESTEFDFPDYRFFRYTKEDINIAKNVNEIKYKKAKEQEIPIVKKELDFTEIKNVLRKRPCLIRLNIKEIRQTKRNSSNYLAIIGFENNIYKVIDPQIGEIQVSEEKLRGCFESLKDKKHRTRTILVFD